jgi:hypothetical protein
MSRVMDSSSRSHVPLPPGGTMTLETTELHPFQALEMLFHE